MKKYGYKINTIIEMERIDIQSLLRHGTSKTEGIEKTSQYIARSHEAVLPRNLETPQENGKLRDGQYPAETPPYKRSNDW